MLRTGGKIEFSDEAKKLALILGRIDKNQRILDVGCGFGRNIKVLRELGYRNITGVEKNTAIVAENKQQGISCLTPEELEARHGVEQFDVILMSHIIEHFDHVSLKKFIEDYVGFLSAGGFVVIVTPLLYPSFYNDFDHIKPYYPMGLQMVFGPSPSQVQFQSDDVLQLKDIQFYKDQFRLQYYRRFYLSEANPLPLFVNRLLKLFFFVSRGRFGKKIGWIGLYQYLGQRKANPSS
ncbi:MAG: methyltransferase domain-containing protein [Sulfuricaulis sp.]